MSIRDAELEFEINDNEYWVDELDRELDDLFDDDDWDVDEEDDFAEFIEDAFADDFLDWEIDLLDDEV